MKWWITSVFIGFLALRAFAHVGYVLEKSEIEAHQGTDTAFLLQVFKEPSYLFLMLATLAVAALVYFLFHASSEVRHGIANMQAQLLSYTLFVPWVIRLTIGAGLIGAGVSQALISPLEPDHPEFAILQMVLGVLLFLGLALIPALIASAALFFVGVIDNLYLLHNLDFFALAVAGLVLADPRPGLDDVFGIRPFAYLRSQGKWVPLVVRLGIGLTMMGLAVVEKFLNPHVSEAVVEIYRLNEIIPVSTAMWVLSAGALEFGLGLLLLLGIQTRLVAAFTFVVMTFSLFFFAEEVYSHITLFGALSILFITGGGNLSVDHFRARPHPENCAHCEKLRKKAGATPAINGTV